LVTPPNKNNNKGKPMPVIAGSQVTAITTAPATGFTPTGVFVIRVLSGYSQLEVKIAGTTEWLAVAEVRNGGIFAQMWQEAGTAVSVTPDIAGSAYRLTPKNGVPLTADAWSA
jgi:hypothetical protein